MARTPSGRIIGQEWADKYPDKFGGTRGRVGVPCPICGHPTGDCTPHPQETPVNERIIGRHPMQTQQIGRRREDPIPDGFHAGEGDTIVCDDDIRVDFYPKGTKTPNTILVFHKGQVTTRDDVEKRMAFYGHSLPLETK